MERIKNFNQILLAIVGIIAIVFLLSIGVLSLIQFWPRDYEEEGIITTEEAEELTGRGLRQEIISFDEFRLVDSANQIFVLPVSQASLTQPESNAKILGLSNSYNNRYNGGSIYNNIVVYYGLADSSRVLFNERLGISHYFPTKQNGTNYIFVTGNMTDSNGDNLLNGKDLQKIYAFNLDKRELIHISMPDNYTVIRMYEPEKSKMMLLRLGVDRNENGEFEQGIEPVLYMRLDVMHQRLDPIVNNENIENLQVILEGK